MKIAIDQSSRFKLKGPKYFKGIFKCLVVIQAYMTYEMFLFMFF